MNSFHFEISFLAQLNIC